MDVDKTTMCLFVYLLHIFSSIVVHRNDSVNMICHTTSHDHQACHRLQVVKLKILPSIGDQGQMVTEDTEINGGVCST